MTDLHLSMVPPKVADRISPNAWEHARRLLQLRETSGDDLLVALAHLLDNQEGLSPKGAANYILTGYVFPELAGKEAVEP